MKTGKVSFTGILLAKGSLAEQANIDHAIRQKTYGLDKNKRVNLPSEKEVFKYATIVHDSTFIDKNITLYATEDDALKLKAFLNEQRNHAHITSNNETFNGVKGLDNIFKTLRENTKFYKENISKFLTLPETTESADAILTAIKKGIFDFANLAITKK